MKVRRPKVVTIIKRKGIGEDYPPFIRLAHRHYEKSPPIAIKVMNGVRQLTMPTDLMLLCLPEELVGQIDGVEIGYKLKGGREV